MTLRTAIAKLFPFLPAIAVFFLGVASDHLVGTLPPNTLFRIADDFAVAIVLGCVVLFYERRRRRHLKAQLGIIREMNHHVRNALQVISLTTVQQDDESVRIMLRESVDRIDWALREVLPGKGSRFGKGCIPGEARPHRWKRDSDFAGMDPAVGCVWGAVIVTRANKSVIFVRCTKKEAETGSPCAYAQTGNENQPRNHRA